MAKKDEKLSWQDRVKGWWETDTAKAVATIIAVLLIPASVIAWNYATTRADDIRDQLEIGGSSTANLVDETNVEDGGTTENSEAIENETEEQPAEPNDTQENEGQEPANAQNTTDEVNQSNDEETAVGGLGSVQTLPNTASAEYYSVKKGDNIYRISMKVCGNDSYYRSQMNQDYLKVGQTLKVNCN